MKRWYVAVPLVLSSALISASAQRMLLVDTTLGDTYNFCQSIAAFRKAGFAVAYQPLHNLQLESIAQYDALVLILDGTHLRVLLNAVPLLDIFHPLIEHMQKLVQQLKQLRNRMIGIVLPPMGGGAAPLVTQALMHQLPLVAAQDAAHPYHLLVSLIEHCLNAGHAKNKGFDTSLFRADAQYKPAIGVACQTVHAADNKIVLQTLPRRVCFERNTVLKPLYPLGLYTHNTVTGNQFFITQYTTLTFNDITESFIINPFDPQLRQEIIRAFNACVKRCIFCIYSAFCALRKPC